MTFSEIISVILAVGAIITPMFFGFLYWKISQIFVSRSDFNEFKAEQNLKHDDNKSTLRDINNDIKMILVKGKFEP